MFNITGYLGAGYWCTSCGAYVPPGVVHQCGTYTIPVFPPPQPPVYYQWPPTPPITAEQATKMLDRLEAIEKKLEEMCRRSAGRRAPRLYLGAGVKST